MIRYWLVSLILTLPPLWGGFLLSPYARADEWEPPQRRSVPSINKKYHLTLTPDENVAVFRPGFCKVELYQGSTDGARLVWSRYLINDVAPVRAYVSDSGAHLVTMDEWSRLGTLPIVVYGPRGELVCVHSLDTLGLTKRRDHIKKTVSSEWWSEKALVLFGPEDKTILVRLHWGEMLAIRLQDGKVLHEDNVRPEEWQSLTGFLVQHASREILRLLQSEDPQDRETGAVHAGQLHVAEAVSRLRELLADDASYTEGVLMPRQVYFVREAATRAIEEISKQASASNAADSRPAP